MFIFSIIRIYLYLVVFLFIFSRPENRSKAIFYTPRGIFIWKYSYGMGSFHMEEQRLLGQLVYMYTKLVSPALHRCYNNLSRGSPTFGLIIIYLTLYFDFLICDISYDFYLN